MSMIAGGDERVRNAFRKTLREEPSQPSVNATEELGAADILEVRDLANAIARAEQIIRAPGSSRPRDIFDALVATDDCAGPATPAPRPTPVPPPPPTLRTPVPPPPSAASVASRREAETPPPPMPAPPTAHAPLTAPPPMTTPALASNILLVNEDDAFYHPAGRIRTLADVTLDGYRPEPTLLVRARERRRSLSWMVAAIVLPLALLGGLTLVLLEPRAVPAASAAPMATTATTATPAPEPAPSKADSPAVTASPVTSPMTSPMTSPVTAAPAVPVFDVNSLPTAPARAARPRRGR